MINIDARGLSCPEPVIMTKKALDAGENSLKVLVDNFAARENVGRLAKKYDMTISVNENNGEFELILERKQA